MENENKENENNENPEEEKKPEVQEIIVEEKKEVKEEDLLTEEEYVKLTNVILTVPGYLIYGEKEIGKKIEKDRHIYLLIRKIGRRNKALANDLDMAIKDISKSHNIDMLRGFLERTKPSVIPDYTPYVKCH